MIYVMIVVLYIPSFIDIIYIHTKEKKLHLEFDKKLKSKGYEKTDDNYNLVSLIASEVIERDKYATRKLMTMFPFYNLYPLAQIMTQKINQEYKMILNSLDSQEVLDSLEKMKYIFNQNTISKVKENIIHKMNEMIKTDEPSINDNKHIEISENDSLKQLKQKRELLDEMIYLQNLKEIRQDFFQQKTEEDKNLTEKEKQLRLIQRLNKK